jgi:hypothetical protein
VILDSTVLAALSFRLGFSSLTLKVNSGFVATMAGLAPMYINLVMKDFSSGVVAVMRLIYASARANIAARMPE